MLNDTEKALFISGYGDRLSSGYLGNWMRKMLNTAEITRPGGCHLLRHTCATHMLEGGADIRYIQQMLGHSSLDTTSIYTQVAIHQLQQIYNTSRVLTPLLFQLFAFPRINQFIFYKINLTIM